MTRRRLSPALRRSEILDAVTQFAAEHDLEKVPTVEIAKAVGVSEGLLFHHFGSKNGLLGAMLNRIADDYFDRCADIRGADAADTISQVLKLYLDCIEDAPRAWAVLLRPTTNAELAAAYQRLNDATFTLFAQQLDVDTLPPLLHLHLVGYQEMERAMSRAWIETADVPRRQLEAVLTGAFLGGARAAADADRATAKLVARAFAPSAVEDAPRRSTGRAVSSQRTSTTGRPRTPNGGKRGGVGERTGRRRRT